MKCPKCNGKATKIMHISTGLEECQQCGLEYCPTCRGFGTIDSGGVYPWGEGINISCPDCIEKELSK